MVQENSRAKTMEVRKRVRDRVSDFHHRVQKCSDEALEKVLYERMDTYFTQEARLEALDQVLIQLSMEVDQSEELYHLKKISDRINYLEEHFDDIESKLYNRPARPRRDRPNIFDFFRRAQSQSQSEKGSEIHSENEACQELGIENGSSLKKVKRAFRKLIKDLHPDQHNGDRSTEPKLRKLVEAYEFLKKRR